MASNYMVKVYADLIRKGKKTIEEVPDPCLLYTSDAADDCLHV